MDSHYHQIDCHKAVISRAKTNSTAGRANIV